MDLPALTSPVGPSWVAIGCSILGTIQLGLSSTLFGLGAGTLVGATGASMGAAGTGAGLLT